MKAHLDNITKIAEGFGGFPVVVIDPPWPMDGFNFYHSAHKESKTPEEDLYNFMTMNEIRRMDIESLLAKEAKVYLWCTMALIPEALKLVDIWGLKYAYMMTWKKNIGTHPPGRPKYNCEFIVVAHKGKPKLETNAGYYACFEAKAGKHSQKPSEFYEMIANCTKGPRLDMFKSPLY